MPCKAPATLRLALLVILIVKSTSVASLTAQAPPAALSSNVQPVLLELFTSEGCSSCPTADALLKKLDDDGRLGDTNIIAIEEHVDYWNHLGWTDPFSSHDWTERQQQYARALHHDGVYTPQLVINGRTDLVGSSEREVHQRISDLAKPSDASIRISSTNILPKSAEFSIAIEISPTNASSADLWLAVTERGLSSSVLRGENEGRNLAHAAVLRSLTRVRMPHADDSGSMEAKATVHLDRSWNRENLRFVVFLQDRRSLHILGAAVSSSPH